MKNCIKMLAYMRSRWMIIFYTVVWIILLLLMFPTSKHSDDRTEEYEEVIAKKGSKDTIHIVSISCNQDRLREIKVQLKSIVYFTPGPIHLHIITNLEGNKKTFENYLKKWQFFEKDLYFTIYVIDKDSIPDHMDGVKIHTSHGTDNCVNLKLVLHQFFSTLQWILFMEIDTVALTSVRELWDLRQLMNPYQLVGAMPQEIRYTSKYYRPGRHIPFVEPAGVNSGVMLLNLEGMRKREWTSLVKKHYDFYMDRIQTVDQDTINNILHFNPHMLQVLPINWHVQPSHCLCETRFQENRASFHCHALEKEGAYILHGWKNYFNKKIQSTVEVKNTFLKLHNLLHSRLDLENRFSKDIVPRSVYNFTKEDVNRWPPLSISYNMTTGKLKTGKHAPVCGRIIFKNLAQDGSSQQLIEEDKKPVKQSKQKKKTTKVKKTTPVPDEEVDEEVDETVDEDVDETVDETVDEGVDESEVDVEDN